MSGWAWTLSPAAVLATCPLALWGSSVPQYSGTALTEEGSSIEPDGSLAAHRFLLKDGIKQLVRESEGLTEAREKLSNLNLLGPPKHPLGQQCSNIMPLWDWSHWPGNWKLRRHKKYHHVSYRLHGWFLWPRLPFLSLWALLMKRGSGDGNELPRTLLAKPITETQ